MINENIRRRQWHKWFAWYPVFIMDKYRGHEALGYYVWLKTVERKESWYLNSSYFLYREIPESTSEYLDV